MVDRRGPKLGSYVPLLSFDFYGQKCTRASLILAIFVDTTAHVTGLVTKHASLYFCRQWLIELDTEDNSSVCLLWFCY